VKYIDNKQLGVSLLNGVVFKIFFLEPAVKWEPNKLSVLLRISNLGTNILFIGVVEKKKKKGDFIARQFQTEEDLSSVTSLVSNKDNIIKIVESVSTYTEVYKSFMKLKTLCCGFAETLVICIIHHKKKLGF
jgi:beta-lactamase superfamily II metal-dependent hydrolase